MIWNNQLLGCLKTKSEQPYYAHFVIWCGCHHEICIRDRDGACRTCNSCMHKLKTKNLKSKSKIDVKWCIIDIRIGIIPLGWLKFYSVWFVFLSFKNFLSIQKKLKKLNNVTLMIGSIIIYFCTQFGHKYIRNNLDFLTFRHFYFVTNFWPLLVPYCC